jgi:hypothetical protein
MDKFSREVKPYLQQAIKNKSNNSGAPLKIIRHKNLTGTGKISRFE